MATSSTRRRYLTATALVGICASAACTQIDNALAAVPVFAFMRTSPFFDPYEHPLPPPAGSVPFESPNGIALPPLEASVTALNAFAAGPYGRNPLAADDQNALALGQVMYERHCAVCHGTQGRGDGPVVGPRKFPVGSVPPVASGNSLTLSDGYIYAIIRAGRGLMPSYGARLTHIERWSVVTYVNQLQGGGAAPAGAPAPAVTPPPTTTGQ